MAPRRPSSARRTGEILAPTDTTGGAAPVYEADDRTYDHRVGGRGQVISRDADAGGGARATCGRGRAPGDVAPTIGRCAGSGGTTSSLAPGRGPRAIIGKSAPTSFTPASWAAPARC